MDYNSDKTLVTRAEAIRWGLRTYYTGVPCKHDHLSRRTVSNGSCNECVSESVKQRRAAGLIRVNPDKARAAQARYRQTPKSKARAEKWKNNNPKAHWAHKTACSLRATAKRKGFNYDLTPAYLLQIAPDTCPVFGVPFMFVGGKCIHEFSPSVDRVNNLFGYTKDNVVVISMKANVIKNAYQSDDVRTVANWLEKQEHMRGMKNTILPAADAVQDALEGL